MGIETTYGNYTIKFLLGNLENGKNDKWVAYDSEGNEVARSRIGLRELQRALDKKGEEQKTQKPVECLLNLGDSFADCTITSYDNDSGVFRYSYISTNKWNKGAKVRQTTYNPSSLFPKTTENLSLMGKFAELEKQIEWLEKGKEAILAQMKGYDNETLKGEFTK
jgi:hypothetical protein